MESAESVVVEKGASNKANRPALLGSNLKQYTMFVALIAIWLLFAILNPIFLTPRNLSTLFVQSANTAILAIGMVLIIAAGHIDLSVGSVLGFTGGICALCMIQYDMGAISSSGITLIIGLLIGAWHGFWVAYMKVPAFIVTLSSYLGFKGLMIGVTGGQTLGLELAATKTSELFKKIGQGYLPTIAKNVEEGQFHDTSFIVACIGILAFIILSLRKRASRVRYGFNVVPIGLELARLAAVSAVIGLFSWIMIIYMGIPWVVILVALLTISFSFIANNTTLGRHIYAIGGNPDAARLSGIDIRRKTFYLFMIMGVVSALAGIVYTSRSNSATPSAGQNAELDAIASAVIGGTSLMGGEGTIFGAVIGALVMTSLDNGMGLMNLESWLQYPIKGMVLLLAVFVDMMQRKK